MHAVSIGAIGGLLYANLQSDFRAAAGREGVILLQKVINSVTGIVCGGAAGFVLEVWVYSFKKLSACIIQVGEKKECTTLDYIDIGFIAAASSFVLTTFSILFSRSPSTTQPDEYGPLLV